MRGSSERRRAAPLALAALLFAAGCSRAGEVAPAAASATTAAAPKAAAPAASKVSAPAVVVTDIAHWKHPTKAVFAKYQVTVQSVTVQDRVATFQVAFPFDPQTGPNAARLQALCLDLLKANGGWAYSLVSPADHVQFDVEWDKRANQINIDNHEI